MRTDNNEDDETIYADNTDGTMMTSTFDMMQLKMCLIFMNKILKER